MKQLAKYLLPLCCGIALASCYGLDKEEYRELKRLLEGRAGRGTL